MRRLRSEHKTEIGAEESPMKFRPFGIALGFVIVTLAAGLAFAQGGRSSLSGVVQDAQGGVLPGVTVVVTDPTGTKMPTVTNEKGVFSVPSIAAGTYTVTLTMSGFKTTVLEKVVVIAASPLSLNVTMTLGGMEETVEVSASSPLVQTQSTTVTTTLTPTPSRSSPW